MLWAVLVALAGVWMMLRRANELCTLRVESGKCRVVRGRAPPRLIGDVEEIAHRARVREATVRVVVESGEPRAIMDASVAEAVQQQIRNVVGQHRVVHFRTGVAP